MKTVAGFGQGDGYGDGKVYVFLTSEIKDFVKTTATFETPEITKNAKEALKYGGSTNEEDGLRDFDGKWSCDLTIFHSKKVCRLFNVPPMITTKKFVPDQKTRLGL